MKLKKLAALDITPLQFYVFDENGNKLAADFRGAIKKNKHVKNADIVRVEAYNYGYYITVKI